MFITSILDFIHTQKIFIYGLPKDKFLTPPLKISFMHKYVGVNVLLCVVVNKKGKTMNAKTVARKGHKSKKSWLSKICFGGRFIIIESCFTKVRAKLLFI